MMGTGFERELITLHNIHYATYGIIVVGRIDAYEGPGVGKQRDAAKFREQPSDCTAGPALGSINAATSRQTPHVYKINQ